MKYHKNDNSKEKNIIKMICKCLQKLFIVFCLQSCALPEAPFKKAEIIEPEFIEEKVYCMPEEPELDGYDKGVWITDEELEEERNK